MLTISLFIILAFLLARFVIGSVQRYLEGRARGRAFKRMLTQGRLEAGVYADALWSATQGFTLVDNGITSVIADNQEIRDGDDDITFYATYPANATDEFGNLIVEFEPSGVALMFGATASMTSGFYIGPDYGTPYVWEASPNGYMTLSVAKKDVRDLALQFQSQGSKPAYFGFNFTLLYTVNSGGNTITKSVMINISGALADYGITL